jgi:DNA-binding NarL/FixJ family response regulator
MYPSLKSVNGVLRPLRVLVVSASPFARAGLAGLIDQQPGLSVSGQAAPDQTVMDALELVRPDVLVWEMGWEAPAALDRLAEMREHAGQTMPPVLALIADDASASANAALLLNAGARGVIVQDANADRLSAALTALGQGLIVVTPAYMPMSAPSALPAAALDNTVDALTPREGEVLRLIAEGLPNKIIAQKLAISEHTVKFHVNAILTKLGAQSRTEAVVRATRAGMLSL